MQRKTKPPKLTKPSAKKRIAIKAMAQDQLADLRRRLQKIDADRKAKAKPEPKKKRGRPPNPKPATTTTTKPKERKMVRYRRSDEDIELGDSKAADATTVDEPTKVYIFHLNLVTPAVEATEDQPAIPEYTEQQAEGVRWSDRTYTIHWTKAGPAVGYLTYPSLRHLRDTYPKLTINFVEDPNLVTPLGDDDAADLELKQKEADAAAIIAREARQRAEEAKARMEARQREHA